jgi:hypothetical protein
LKYKPTTSQDALRMKVVVTYTCSAHDIGVWFVSFDSGEAWHGPARRPDDMLDRLCPAWRHFLEAPQLSPASEDEGLRNGKQPRAKIAQPM